MDSTTNAYESEFVQILYESSTILIPGLACYTHISLICKDMCIMTDHSTYSRHINILVYISYANFSHKCEMLKSISASCYLLLY